MACDARGRVMHGSDMIQKQERAARSRSRGPSLLFVIFAF